jgi:Ca2+-binding RTX toxin-like protein
MLNHSGGILLKTVSCFCEGLRHSSDKASRSLNRSRAIRRSRAVAVRPQSLESRLLLSAPHPLNLNTLDGANGFRIEGISPEDMAGSSLSAVGDINGDGFDDVILGAPQADIPTAEAGGAYVIFGTAGGFTSSILLSTLDGTNGFRIEGAEPGDAAGRAVSGAGDVNGDGFDDLLIGSNTASPADQEFAGACYVVFGKASGFSSSLNLSVLSGSDGFVIQGRDPGDASILSTAWVAAAGDVNGDGLSDLMTGFSGGDGLDNLVSDAGECYVVFGSTGSFSAVFNLASLDGTNGFRITGVEEFDAAGFAISTAGDMNGDGLDDLIVSNDSAYSTLAGRCFIVFGRSSGFSGDLNLSSLNGANGFAFYGRSDGDFFGYSVSSAGDVNNDGLGDIIVGAPWATLNNNAFTGAAYVLFGKKTAFSSVVSASSLNGNNGYRLQGIHANDFAGLSVSGAGDVNGDGIDDVIIGASGGDPGNRSDSGEAYVVFGSPSGFSATLALDGLNGLNGFRLEGNSADDTAGVAVSGAGDINGDGFHDMVLGATLADPGNVVDAGESYLIFGGNFTGGAETQVGTSGADTLAANSGITVTDILTGAQGNDNLSSDGGPDVLLGGEGNDILTVPGLTFRRVDGGSGTDTLNLMGASLNFNLTGTVGSRVRDVEIIDITGTGNNTLSLSASAVARISSSSNTLMVRRDGGDVVNTGQGWTELPSQTIDGDSYQVFGAGVLKLLIQQCTSLSVNQVLEQHPAGTLVGALLTNNSEAGSLFGYTMVSGQGSEDNDSFQLDGNRISTNAVFTLSSKSTYSIRVRTADVNAASFETIITISVMAQPAGTSLNDTFTLAYLGSGSSGSVSVSMSTAGSSARYSGTFALSASLIVDGLDGTDSVFIVGTSGDDTMNVAETGISINGSSLQLANIEFRQLGGLAGNDIYRFDADTALGLFNLDETGRGVDTLDFSPTTTTGVNLNLSLAVAQAVTPGLSLNLQSNFRFENITGGAGDDTLIGNSLSNILTGNSGNDKLNGADGSDVLTGGQGNDSYYFGAASGGGEVDRINEFSSQGTDLLSFSSVTSDISLNLGSVAVQDVHAARKLQLSSAAGIENVFAGTGNDTLIGNQLANSISGNLGNDKFNGGPGNDWLRGGKGDDAYYFGTPTSTGEADTLAELSAEGTDTLSFIPLQTGLTLNLGNNVVQTIHSGRTLRLSSGAAFENVIGGAGNDVLTGNALDNRLVGNDGNDILIGNSGNDQLVGWNGRDIQIGGAGLDLLEGGNDDDILIAGSSAHDASISGLTVLQAEWTSSKTYNNRVSSLRGGVGSPAVSLKAKVSVFNDAGDSDLLTGGPGNDWYIAAVNDVLSSKQTWEFLDLL